MKISFEDIPYIIRAHQLHPRKSSKAYRKWDGETPYSMHPLWCATTILTETTLDEKTRIEGYYALLYHDLLEDTTLPLPPGLEKRIQDIVMDMTFPGGSEQEIKEIWSKPKEIRLYKLYDKVSNLLDGNWMSLQKRKDYEDYTWRLCKDVEHNYSSLNITRIARAIVSCPIEHDAIIRPEKDTTRGEHGLY